MKQFFLIEFRALAHFLNSVVNTELPDKKPRYHVIPISLSLGNNFLCTLLVQNETNQDKTKQKLNCCLITWRKFAQSSGSVQTIKSSLCHEISKFTKQQILPSKCTMSTFLVIPKFLQCTSNNLKLTSFCREYKSSRSIINHLILVGTRDHDIPLVKEEQRLPLPAYDISWICHYIHTNFDYFQPPQLGIRSLNERFTKV